MTKTHKLKTQRKSEIEVETYLAPPPPTQGKIIGLDCHPDTFTAAVFVGQTPHDARKIGSRENLSMEALMRWAAEELSCADIILMEAGSNSFEICKRLGRLGLRVCVLESCHVGKHAKTYADNDRMAAARIALVYLAGNAPCVWVPDEESRERRELLHSYRKAVRAHTADTNTLVAYLNANGIRLGKRSLQQPTTKAWILGQREWSALQVQILEEKLGAIAESQERRRRLYRVIAAQMANEAQMLRCMKVLGVGIVSAFALLAVIGDVSRFHSAQKLVAYAGLNPGQRQSGRGKDIRLGVGKRGRSDIRELLIQGAQSVLVHGRHTALGQWGWKLFARKGNRNVAVVAIARKLLVQVWHLLRGNPPVALEGTKSLCEKLRKLAVTLGTALRKELGLEVGIARSVEILLMRTQPEQTPICPIQPV